MTIRRILETGGEDQRLKLHRRDDGLYELEIGGKQYAYDVNEMRELATFVMSETPDPLPEYLQ